MFKTYADSREGSVQDDEEICHRHPPFNALLHMQEAANERTHVSTQWESQNSVSLVIPKQMLLNGLL